MNTIDKQFYEYKTIIHNEMDVVIIMHKECGFTAWLANIPGVVVQGETEEEALSEISISYEIWERLNVTNNDLGEIL